MSLGGLEGTVAPLAGRDGVSQGLTPSLLSPALLSPLPLCPRVSPAPVPNLLPPCGVPGLHGRSRPVPAPVGTRSRVLWRYDSREPAPVPFVPWVQHRDDDGAVNPIVPINPVVPINGWLGGDRGVGGGRWLAAKPPSSRGDGAHAGARGTEEGLGLPRFGAVSSFGGTTSRKGPGAEAGTRSADGGDEVG